MTRGDRDDPDALKALRLGLMPHGSQKQNEVRSELID